MDQERWEKFTKREQLGHLASELLRANHFEDNDKELYQGCLKRAMDLAEGIIQDPRWEYMKDGFSFLRSELIDMYEGKKVGVLRLYNDL